MNELEYKISILIQEQQPITESEAQDLAHFICELPEIKAIQQEPLVSQNTADIERIKYLEDELFARGAMVNAPCFCCGYSGEGYFQPDKHPCAEKHHKLYRGF
jgi:hypothetical protein